MENKNCVNCGNQVMGGENFCNNCGTAINNNQSQSFATQQPEDNFNQPQAFANQDLVRNENNNGKKSNKKIFLIIGGIVAVLAIVAVILFVFVFSSSSDDNSRNDNSRDNDIIDNDSRDNNSRNNNSRDDNTNNRNGSAETLSCSMEMDLDGFIMKMEQHVEIRNSRAYSTDLILTTIFVEDGAFAAIMDANEFLEEYAAELESTRDGFGEFRGMDGVTFTSDIRGNQHILRILIDYSNVNSSQIAALRSAAAIDAFVGWDERVTIRETRIELEAQGFTCN